MSTSVSTSSPKTPAKPRRSRRSGGKGNLRKWIIVLATLGLCFLLFFVVSTQGNVRGKEFAPSHFQSRLFSFYEIPFLHIQITPIRRKGTTNLTANYVRQQGFIKTAKSVPTDDDWHLVDLNRGLSGRTAGDPILLLEQLELHSGNSSPHWRQWSEDHPKQAAVLWPVVQRLAVRELYFLIPSVFELATIDTAPDALAIKIDQLLQSEYESLVKDMREAGRTELAEQLLQEAITDFPDHKGLKTLDTPNK